jgi:talin
LCPAAIADAPKDKQAQMLGAGRSAAQALIQLLAGVKENALAGATPASKAKVQATAKTVADAVNRIVEAASSLVPAGYVDPNDPNVVAERELLAAAASIEAAARKLAALVPAERPRAANESLNFEEQILEAVKAIAAASSALVRSATQAQRELMAAGRVGPAEDKVYFSDGQWADGLVSASRLVAASTKELCDCANNAVQGGADKPMLIASANAVASSTAQLLSSATVKMDPSSESGQRLRAAGAAVVRATKSLVESAEANMALDDPTKLMDQFAALSVVGARKMEIEQKAKLERLRLEFEQAQREYSAIQNAKYAKK